MKTSLVLGGALAALLVSSISSAAVKNYTATLNGAQEAPTPVTTAATGTATLAYDDVSRDLTGTVVLMNIQNVTGQHIHKGACGVAGGVEVTLPAPTANTITVNQKIPMGNAAAFKTALEAGELYVNIHTTANVGGEIRGQLYEVGSGTTCPAGSDAGTDGGSSSGGTDAGSTSSSSSGGSSSGGSSSGGSSSGTSGATTERVDSGTASAAPAEDDGGCSTTGSSTSGNGLAIALGLGLALAGLARARGKNEK